MEHRKFHQIIFVLAGIYNICWGLFTALYPGWLFNFARMEPMNYPDIFACVGMIVGLYGIVYLEVARVPERGFLLAAVGLTGKILGPIGAVMLVMQGKWNFAALLMNLTNDLIWWIPFGLYLYDSWGFYKVDFLTRDGVEKLTGE